MKNLQTLTENYLEYCRTQKCLNEKTLKAYRIDLRQFSEEPSLEKIIEKEKIFQKIFFLF